MRLTQRFVDALAGKKADKTWDEAVAAEAAAAAERVEPAQEQEHVEAARAHDHAPLQAQVKAGPKSRPGIVKRDTGVVWKTPMRDTAGSGDYFALAREGGGANGANGNGEAALRTDDDDDERRDELLRLRRDLKTYQVRLLSLVMMALLAELKS